MNINIADNLKRLRKQKELTQEDLASFLGVSFQSVSKWERNECFPDITVLPSIANFFEVTLDELVGMNEIRNEARLVEINNIIKDNYAKGKIEEQIILLREAVKQFPNNFNLLSELAFSLSMLQTDSVNQNKNLEEAIAICERIMNHCLDNKIRSTVQGNLCFYYDRNGQKDKAIALAKELPNIWKCRDLVLSNLLNGEEKIKTVQENLSRLTEAIWLQIRDLADVDYRYDTNWSIEQKIALLEKSNQIFNLVYDQGDYLYYHIRFAENYRKMAALSLLENNTEKAIDYLEIAIKHTIAYDTLPLKDKYTSILVNRLEYDKYNTTSNNPHNWSYIMLNDYLPQDRYDVLREDNRFIELITQLQKYAQ